MGHRQSQAIQNGSVRLQAVDSMAKRASGRRARIGRKAAIKSLGKSCCLIRHNPSVHRHSADGIVAAWQRQHA